ncbi:DUF4124 domain-containing protein [Pseudomonas sp. NA-150]|uniref:DUF4124 domain-containing protein n=1 Tax=Pseudomonas sp. NA-150 TaxID=3367525 RepID=UPI0037CA6038
MSVNLESPLRTLLVKGLLVCLLLISGSASAEVYSYVDAQGNRVFTDRPHSGAKRVEILPSNSMNQPTTKTVAKAKPPIAKPGPLFHYDLLRILVPEPDATIRNIAGDLIVSINSDPVLQNAHSYRLLLDGKPFGEPGRSPVFPLTNIDRGTHQLAVEILDESGRMLERTPTQDFHMLRISLAQKRLAQPCTEEDYGVRPECPLADKPKDPIGIFHFF